VSKIKKDKLFNIHTLLFSYIFITFILNVCRKIYNTRVVLVEINFVCINYLWIITLYTYCIIEACTENYTSTDLRYIKYLFDYLETKQSKYIKNIKRLSIAAFIFCFIYVLKILYCTHIVSIYKKSYLISRKL